MQNVSSANTSCNKIALQSNTMLSQKVAGNAKYKDYPYTDYQGYKQVEYAYLFLIKKANRGDVYPSPTGTSGSIHNDEVETHTNVTL